MYLQKVISKKTWKRKLIFCCHLESHWQKEQDPDPDLYPLSSVRIQGSGSIKKCHRSGTLKSEVVPVRICFNAGSSIYCYCGSGHVQLGIRFGVKRNSDFVSFMATGSGSRVRRAKVIRDPPIRIRIRNTAWMFAVLIKYFLLTSRHWIFYRTLVLVFLFFCANFLRYCSSFLKIWHLMFCLNSYLAFCCMCSRSICLFCILELN